MNTEFWEEGKSPQKTETKRVEEKINRKIIEFKYNKQREDEMRREKAPRGKVFERL